MKEHFQVAGELGGVRVPDAHAAAPGEALPEQPHPAYQSSEAPLTLGGNILPFGIAYTSEVVDSPRLQANTPTGDGNGNSAFDD